MEEALEEINRLREALEIISGARQCADNTLGNAEIAKLTLMHK